MKEYSFDVSTIIVNYNTTAYTIRCIEAIKKYTLHNSYEIIVVDNASSDTSIQQIQKIFPDVKYIQSEENIGFGRANNEGLKIAQGKYMFLLNTDAFLLSDAIHSFWKFMEKADNNIACCGGDLVDEFDNRVVSYGNFPSVLEAFSSIGFSFFYKQYYKNHIHSGVVNHSDHVRNVDYITGADMFIRKSALDKIGFFDPDFFLYFEETELSFRMYKAGFVSVILPDVKIIHVGGGSQKSDDIINYRQLELFSKSQNLFFNKCYGKWQASLAKALFTLRALLFVLVKRKKEYKKAAQIIWNS